MRNTEIEKKSPAPEGTERSHLAAAGGNWVSVFDAALVGLAGHGSARDVRIDAGVGNGVERAGRLRVVNQADAADHRLLIEGTEHPALGQDRTQRAAEVATVKGRRQIGHWSALVLGYRGTIRWRVGLEHSICCDLDLILAAVRYNASLEPLEDGRLLAAQHTADFRLTAVMVEKLLGGHSHGF